MGTPKTQATLPGSIPTGAGGVRPTVQRHYIAERDPTTEYTNPSRCDVTPPRPKINDTVPPGHGVEIDNSTNPFSHLLVPSPDPALSIVPTEGRRSKTRDDKHPIPPCLPTEAKKNRLPGSIKPPCFYFQPAPEPTSAKPARLKTDSQGQRTLQISDGTTLQTSTQTRAKRLGDYIPPQSLVLDKWELPGPEPIGSTSEASGTTGKRSGARGTNPQVDGERY